MSYKDSLCYYFDETANKHLYHVNCGSCKNYNICNDPFKKDLGDEIGFNECGTIITEPSALNRKKYHDDLYGKPKTTNENDY